MRFMFRKRRKRKSKQVTLKDLKKILIKTENTDMFLLRLKQKSHMQLQNIQRRNGSGGKKLRI